MYANKYALSVTQGRHFVGSIRRVLLKMLK
jgi:hypothetical protein